MDEKKTKQDKFEQDEFEKEWARLISDNPFEDKTVSEESTVTHNDTLDKVSAEKQKVILETIFKGKSISGYNQDGKPIERYDPFNAEDAQKNYNALKDVTVEVILENPNWAKAIFKKRKNKDGSEIISNERNFRNELAERPDLVRKYHEMKVKQAFKVGDTQRVDKNLGKLNPGEKNQITEKTEPNEKSSLRKLSGNINKILSFPFKKPPQETEEPRNASTELLEIIIKNILVDKSSVKFETHENNQVVAVFNGKEHNMKKILQESNFNQIKFDKNDFKNYEDFLGNKETLMKPQLATNATLNIPIDFNKLNIDKKTTSIIEDISAINSILKKNCKGGKMENTSTAEKLAANVYSTQAYTVICPMFRAEFSGSNGYDIHLISSHPEQGEKFVGYKDSYLFCGDGNPKLYYVDHKADFKEVTIKNPLKLLNDIDHINENKADKVNLSREKFEETITLNGGHVRLNSTNLAETMLTGSVLIHCLNTITKNEKKEEKINAFRIDKALPQNIVDERMEAAKNNNTTVLSGIVSTAIDKPDSGFYTALFKPSDDSTTSKECKVATVFTGIEPADISDVNCYGEKEIIIKPNTTIQWNYGAKIGDIYYLSGSPATNSQTTRAKSDLDLSGGDTAFIDVKELDSLLQQENKTVEPSPLEPILQRENTALDPNLENEFNKIAGDLKDFLEVTLNLNNNSIKQNVEDKPIENSILKSQDTLPEISQKLNGFKAEADILFSKLEISTQDLNDKLHPVNVQTQELSLLYTKIRALEAETSDPALKEQIKQVKTDIGTHLHQLTANVTQHINAETGRGIDSAASSRISGAPSRPLQKNPLHIQDDICNALTSVLQDNKDFKIERTSRSESVIVMKDGENFASVNSKEIQALSAKNSADDYKILIQAALKNYDKPLLIYVPESEKPALDKAINQLKENPKSNLKITDFECTTDLREYKAKQDAKEAASAAKSEPISSPGPKRAPIIPANQTRL